MSEGIKHDQDKLRTDLIPVEAVLGVAKVMTHGAKKYGDRNWEKGIKYSRIYAAILRHLYSWWLGEEIDPESGLHHIDHADTETQFLSTFIKRGRIDLDDRPIKKDEPVSLPKVEDTPPSTGVVDKTSDNQLVTDHIPNSTLCNCLNCYLRRMRGPLKVDDPVRKMGTEASK